MHITGGNFEDPPYRVVPDPHKLGFPLAEVVGRLRRRHQARRHRRRGRRADHEDAGLLRDPRPAAYLTPDVTADFSTVTFEDLGGDRVRLGGARGRPRPDPPQGARRRGPGVEGHRRDVLRRPRLRRAGPAGRGDRAAAPGPVRRPDRRRALRPAGVRLAVRRPAPRRLSDGGAAADGAAHPGRRRGPRGGARDGAPLLRAGRWRGSRGEHRAGARRHPGVRARGTWSSSTWRSCPHEAARARLQPLRRQGRGEQHLRVRLRPRRLPASWPSG